MCQQESDYCAIVWFLFFPPVPEAIGGRQLTATVIDLSPWVEYEFRVLASNTIGTGEPSKPSKQARTKGTCECLRYALCSLLKNASRNKVRENVDQQLLIKFGVTVAQMIECVVQYPKGWRSIQVSHVLGQDT